MHVFDFDNTIYNGDSNIDFFFFILKRHFNLLIRLPKVFVFGFLFFFHLCPRNKFKEIFFQSYIPYINIENEVSLFWKKHKTKIKQWYLNIKRNNDLIISASPEFLLLPICTEWSVKLIATKIDIYTGKILGKNCYGQEKVKRFLKEFPTTKIKKFYTDSLSDMPMMKLSKTNFLITGNVIKAIKNNSSKENLRNVNAEEKYHGERK